MKFCFYTPPLSARDVSVECYRGGFGMRVIWALFLTHPLAHAISLSPSLFLILPPPLPPSLSLSNTHSLSRSLTHSLALSPSLSFTHTHSLAHSRSFPPSRSQSRPPSLTLSLTLTLLGTDGGPSVPAHPHALTHKHELNIRAPARSH